MDGCLLHPPPTKPCILTT
ncbi:hypothetical protein Zm00014a_040054 [Zea mays]|uniref:Uncharacterized protein n=1 Tax=Zea mays TaxID=4577 RepID=A0A3L6E572_MAIZE|nr:hypothetical protein Zm00014a_040054 [Zea mays]